VERSPGRYFEEMILLTKQPLATSGQIKSLAYWM
jgi:hypothetical protein